MFLLRISIRVMRFIPGSIFVLHNFKPPPPLPPKKKEKKFDAKIKIQQKLSGVAMELFRML